MDEQNLQNRREEAKRAMGGGDSKPESKPHPSASSRLPEEKLEKARNAMLGEDYAKQQAFKKAELDKKRAEARKQMEGYERRRERELAEYKQKEVERVKAELAKKKEEQSAEGLEEQKRKEELERQKEEEQKTYDERLAASKALVEKLKNESSADVKPYHTLSTDISEVIKNDKLSMADIALKSEEKARTASPAEESKNKFVIGLVVILIVVGSASIFTVWVLIKDLGSASYVENRTTLITTEEIKTIDATGKPASALRHETASLLADLKNSPRSLTDISFEETITVDEEKQIIHFSSTDFLRRLGINTGQGFALALKPRYMVGLYTEDDLSVSPLYVFTIQSFEQAFGSILKEENRIIAELLDLFGVNTDFISQGNFKDKFISNINVRVVESADGGEKAFYAFPNKSTLIVTNSQPALLELIEAIRLINITQ